MGSKEGAVNCNIMVAMSYNKGIVLCEQYQGAINGDKMVEIVNNSFVMPLCRATVQEQSTFYRTVVLGRTVRKL